MEKSLLDSEYVKSMAPFSTSDTEALAKLYNTITSDDGPFSVECGKCHVTFNSFFKSFKRCPICGAPRIRVK